MLYDPFTLVLLIVGFLLVMAGAILITSFGKRYPFTVLCSYMTALVIYLSVILFRVGVFAVPW